MPKLNRIEDIYYEAFLELGSERVSGMSLGAIPRSKIKEYADELELDCREAEAFRYVVYHLDIHYRSIQAAKTEKSMKK